MDPFSDPWARVSDLDEQLIERLAALSSIIDPVPECTAETVRLEFAFAFAFAVGRPAAPLPLPTRRAG